MNTTTNPSDFKWRHFRGEIILWAVRWYCKYAVSYRNLEEMLYESGVIDPVFKQLNNPERVNTKSSTSKGWQNSPSDSFRYFVTGAISRSRNDLPMGPTLCAPDRKRSALVLETSILFK